MIGLKEKKPSTDSKIDVQTLLNQYQEIYEMYINDQNIYALLTSKNKKRKIELIKRADALFHIACVSLKAGNIRKSLKFFSGFRCICDEIWS